MFLDLPRRELIAYFSEQVAAEVHKTYGGKNYYQSRSGASGAGWIPSGLNVAESVDLQG